MRRLKDYKADARRPVEASAESVDRAAAKYSGMNENELMGELMKSVASAKNDGSFNAAELDEFAAFVSPNLDEDQRKRLAELIRMVKG